MTLDPPESPRNTRKRNLDRALSRPESCLCQNERGAKSGTTDLFVCAEQGEVLGGLAYCPRSHEVGQMQAVFHPRDILCAKPFRCRCRIVCPSLRPPARGEGLGKVGKYF